MPVETECGTAAAPFRAGTGNAFAALIVEHQKMVYSIAYRFLRHRDAAEELAQDVFLELYRTQPVFYSESHLTFWLRKTTSHRCIDQARRRRLRPKIGLDEIPEPSSWLAMSDPFLRRMIDQVVTRLPEVPRLVMILRYQEDLQPAEIAALLDMPVNTVKSHLQRSLDILRDKLKDRGEA